MLYEFSSYAKPDFHIHIGDLLNCASVSRHNKNNRLIQALNPIEDDFAAGNVHFDKLAKATPNADLYYLEGNHEYWCKQYEAEHPASKNQFNVVRQLRLKERGVKFVPYETQREKPLTLGKMDFVHGFYCGTHHAFKTANEADRNICYGHTHTYQIACRKGLSRARHIAVSIGHLSDEYSIAMRYMRTPSDWIKAFAIYQYDEASGQFNIEVKPIPNYRFFWHGKLWKN